MLQVEVALQQAPLAGQRQGSGNVQAVPVAESADDVQDLEQPRSKRLDVEAVGRVDARDADQSIETIRTLSWKTPW